MPGTAATQVKEALDGGVRFLLTAQGPDGRWRDVRTLAGEATDWPTAFVGERLLEAGIRGGSVGAAVDALLKDQHADGGWGYHRRVPSDADSTACALAFLARTGRTRQGALRAGRRLLRHQDPGGGGVSTYADPDPIRRYLGVGRDVDAAGWCTRHLEVTATAGRALAAIPADSFADRADLAWRYVAQRQGADGGWSAYWWADRSYPTWQAVALAHALGTGDDLVAAAAGWVQSQQLPDGAWRGASEEPSAFGTALSVATLRLAGGHDDAVRRGVAALLAMQHRDGGWPGHASMRIPPPDVTEPDHYEGWRVDEPGTGVVVADHHRLFTTAACVAALAAGSAP